MALVSQLNNFVKVRTTRLSIVPADYERIHVTKFNFKDLAEKKIAIMNGQRTVLVINGDNEASDFDNKTVAQIKTDLVALTDALEETRS